MSIWNTLGKPGDPVDGQPWEFQALEDRFRTIKQQMLGVDRSFDAIRQGSSADFQGQAASAFSSKLNTIAAAVGEVPLIAGQIEATFRNHRTQLEALCREADSAIARAQANWNEKGAAEADHDEAKKHLSWVDRQFRWVDTHPDQESERPYWTGKKIDAQHWVSGSAGRLNRARDSVDASKNEWNRLRDREDTLDNETAQRLRDTVLWSLADPSLVEQFQEAWDSFFEGLKEFGEYLFSWEFIEDLYAALGAVILVLSVLSLLFPGLAGIVLALSAIKLMLGVLMFSFGEGGVGLGDLLLDALGVILSGAALAAKQLTLVGKLPGISKTVQSGRGIERARMVWKQTETVEFLLNWVPIFSGKSFKDFNDDLAKLTDVETVNAWTPVIQSTVRFTPIGLLSPVPLIPIALPLFNWTRPSFTLPSIRVALTPVGGM